MSACDDDAEAGYTEDYVPEAYPSLDEAYDAVLVAGNDSDYLVSDSNLNCSLYLGEPFFPQGIGEGAGSFVL